MNIVNHCASEGKPATSSQVFNTVNRAICFRASKRTRAHLRKLALRWVRNLALRWVRNPLFPLWVLNIFHKCIWYFPWSKHNETADGSTWLEAWFLLVTWVYMQSKSKEQSLAELTVFICYHLQAWSQTGNSTPWSREAEKWNQSNFQLVTLLNLARIAELVTPWDKPQKEQNLKW